MSVRPELRFSGISSESFRKGVIRNKGSENEIKKGAVKKRVFYSPLKMPGGIPAFFKGILIGLALRVVEIQGNVVEKGRFFINGVCCVLYQFDAADGEDRVCIWGRRGT